MPVVTAPLFPAAAAASAAPTGGSSPGPAAVTNDALNDAFDPMLAPEKPKEPGLLNSSELDFLNTKTTQDNLISFGNADEFDPVAQTWLKEQAATQPAAAPAPAAAAAEVAEPAAAAAAPAPAAAPAT